MTTPESSLEDQFLGAKILFQEGFLEDAKKSLHQILIINPDFSVAQSLLAQIQENEIKATLADSTYLRKQKNAEANEDTVQILKKLADDFGLDLDENKSFQENQLQSLLPKIEAIYQDATAQDWVDLGIAFLEIESFVIAETLFEKALRTHHQSQTSKTAYTQQSISIICLLAETLLKQNRNFEAFSYLQNLVQDTEIPLPQKVEPLFLTGLCYLAMNKVDLAEQHFQQVKELDPNHHGIDRKKHDQT